MLGNNNLEGTIPDVLPVASPLQVLSLYNNFNITGTSRRPSLPFVDRRSPDS